MAGRERKKRLQNIFRQEGNTNIESEILNSKSVSHTLNCSGCWKRRGKNMVEESAFRVIHTILDSLLRMTLSC